MADTSRLASALGGRYRIERELGAGGMATVYLAHDVRHDRRVALKVLRPELSAILSAERFVHEIKTTANLQQLHILSLFDSGEADGHVFYAMPFVALSATGTLIYGHSLGLQTGDRLEWVDRQGRVEVIDSTWAGAVSDVALSPDGRRVAVTRNDDGGRNVWVKELDHGPLSRLSFSNPPNFSVAWTPHGRSVSYTSVTSGNQRDVYARRADGSAPAALLFAAPRPVMYAAVSRDGQWIVYQVAAGTATTGRDIYARRLQGDTTPLEIAATPALREESPRLPPDGRWVAYASNETGRGEVYVRPFPNAAVSRAQVSVDGGWEPLWSRNGRELFFTNSEGLLVAARVETAPSVRVLAREPLVDKTPYTFNVEGGLAYDVSPDGRRFITARSGSGAAMQLVVVMNWAADLAAPAR